MKQRTNQFFYRAMPRKIKNHILNNMDFSETDLRIVKSLMQHDGSPEFHYQNTGLTKAKFERHLLDICDVVQAELLRLSNRYLTQIEDNNKNA